MNQEKTMPENVNVKEFQSLIVLGERPSSEEGKSENTIIVTGKGTDLIFLIASAFKQSEELRDVFEKAFLVTRIKESLEEFKRPEPLKTAENNS